MLSTSVILGFVPFYQSVLIHSARAYIPNFKLLLVVSRKNIKSLYKEFVFLQLCQHLAMLVITETTLEILGTDSTLGECVQAKHLAKGLNDSSTLSSSCFSSDCDSARTC